MKNDLNFQNYPFEQQPPEGWELTSLGQIVDSINPGFASGEHNRQGDGVPHLRPMNVNPKGELDLSDVRYVHPDKGVARLKKGDILFNNTNSVVWVGKTAVNRVDTEYAFSNHMTKIEVNENRVNSEFIARQLHYLSTSGYFQVHCKKHVNQASISSKVLGESVPILLPPTNEQKRIVAKIEELQSHSREAREALETIPDLLQQLRQSILAAAFRGDLTKKWRDQHKGQMEPATELLKRIRIERRKRWEEAELDKLKAKGLTGDQLEAQFTKRRKQYKEPELVDKTGLPELPEGWCWTSWKEVGFCQNGRAFPSKNYSKEGVKLLRPGNLHVSGNIEWTPENTRYLPIEWAAEHKEYIIESEELIINLTAQSLKDEFLGRICLSGPSEFCLLNQRLARLSPISISPSFILWLFKSSIFRRYVDKLNTGSLIQHMFTTQIDDFIFPLPPADEQNELLDAVEKMMGLNARFQEYLATFEERLGLIDQTILVKAFQGELVPQAPNDEPASILLERIHQEKARQTDVNKTKKTKIVRKRRMKSLTLESVKSTINQMENNTFSFDDLRQQISGDYESLKDIIFKLLEEREPFIKQIFDQHNETICFVRGDK